MDVGVGQTGTALDRRFVTCVWRFDCSNGSRLCFVELYRYLHARFGHASYERVCSGISIPNIYQFLRDQGTIPEAPAIAARQAQAPQHEQAVIISARSASTS